MKALTLTQPWASLVAIGAKRIETRTWRTAYRGPLAIHAAKGFPASARDAVYLYRFRHALGPHFGGTESGPLDKQLPTGAVIATCRLVSCLPTRELQGNRMIDVDPVANCEYFEMNDQEREFGEYAPGRWAWLLADIKRMDAPISAKGSLSLWDWVGPSTVGETLTTGSSII